MRKILLPLFVVQTLAFNVFAGGQNLDSSDYDESEAEGVAQPGNIPVSYLWSKKSIFSQNTAENAGSTTDYLMSPHSDPVNVMPRVNTTPIFWGSSWNWSFYESDKIIGLIYWYDSFQYSTYANVLTEYLSSPLFHTLFNPIVDVSPASSDPLKVLAEICEVAGYVNNSKSHYYPVYSDIKRGTANYCSYHAAGTCNGNPVQFAFFFDLDDDAGCDPGSPYAPPRGRPNSQRPGSIAGLPSAYQQSQGLAALANVSAHELAETITDPAYFSPDGFSAYWGGWYDSSSFEIGDKCAWTFGPSLISGAPAGTVSIGGFYWKLQGEWSNNAQNAGSAGEGYPTQNNQVYGCVTGS